MRAVVQRVSQASVRVDDELVGAIGMGLCVFVGVGLDDTKHDAELLAEKLVKLRIFSDTDEKMNLSVSDVRGSILLVSQFTLLADCRRGNRPSFTAALEPDAARALFEEVVRNVKALGVDVATGRFRADMRVALENDGPVTILLDTKKAF